MSSTIKIDDLEKIYDYLAETIDVVPIEKRELFLVKLALLSANQIEDPNIFRDLIHQARNLED